MESLSLTLDLNATDKLHTAASRAAALTYAGVIESEKPQLAKEIRTAVLSLDEVTIEVKDDPPPQPVGKFKCHAHGLIDPEDAMNIPNLGTFCGRCYRDLFNDKERLLQLLTKVEPIT